MCAAYDGTKGRNGYRYVPRRERKIRGMIVAVIKTTRVYGGPEEGGWWHDYRECVESHQVYGWTHAMATVRRMRDEYPVPRFDRYSCAGDADLDVRVYGSGTCVERAVYNDPEAGVWQ